MSGAWRTYDIRGATEEVAGIAMALRPHIENLNVLVGHDGSEDARTIADMALRPYPGAVEAVTPVVFWASRWYDLGIMVTASHDGQDGVTGIKICERRRPWSDHEYDRLRALLSGDAVDVGRLIPETSVYRSTDSGHELTAYTRSFEAIGDLPGVHIGIYAGSMAAASCASRAFVSIGAEPVIDVVAGLDPAQPPRDTMCKARYEIFLDADADRCSIRVDGVWWSPAQMLPLLAKTGRARHMGTVALIDLRTPRETVEALNSLGLEPRFTDSGRAMNAAIAETEVAVIGAETASGHFYWPERAGLDDGIWTAAIALKAFEMYGAHWSSKLPINEPERVEERRGVAIGISDLANAATAVTEAEADDGERWRWDDGSWLALRSRTSDGQPTIHWQGVAAQNFAEEMGIA